MLSLFRVVFDRWMFNNPVIEAKVAPGAVSPGAVSPGAVQAKVAPGAVSPGAVQVAPGAVAEGAFQFQGLMAPGAIQVNNLFSLPSSLWVLLVFLPGSAYYFPWLTCGIVGTILSIEMIKLKLETMIKLKLETERKEQLELNTVDHDELTKMRELIEDLSKSLVEMKEKVEGLDGIRNEILNNSLSLNTQFKIQHCDSGKLLTTDPVLRNGSRVRFAEPDWKPNTEDYLWGITTVGRNTVIIHQMGFALDSPRDYHIHLFQYNYNSRSNQYWNILRNEDGTVCIASLNRKGYLNSDGYLEERRTLFNIIKV